MYNYYNKIDRSIEEINQSKYLMLVSNDKSKDTLKKYEEPWRNLTGSISKNSNGYYEKYTKSRFNSNDSLSLKETLELIVNIIKVVRFFLMSATNTRHKFS